MLIFKQKIFIMDRSESFQIENEHMKSSLLSYNPTSEELVGL